MFQEPQRAASVAVAAADDAAVAFEPVAAEVPAAVPELLSAAQQWHLKHLQHLEPTMACNRPKLFEHQGQAVAANVHAETWIDTPPNLSYYENSMHACSICDARRHGHKQKETYRPVPSLTFCNACCRSCRSAVMALQQLSIATIQAASVHHGFAHAYK